ncbi:MAG: ferrous iron transport protein B [Thermodesulfobacteriota bacterium]
MRAGNTELGYGGGVGTGALAARAITIAVAGNPNAGKSTLINAIAGTRLHVGNWPGVTVEKKETLFRAGGRKIRLVDLPGTYSLSPYSEEERIALDYLLHAKPDVIVNVVDATNLERNLYLTIQLLELGIPVIVALNIYDEAQKKGYRIDCPGMAQMLGVTVVPTVATKKKGLDELIGAAVAIASDPQPHQPRELHYGHDIEVAVRELVKQLARRYPGLLKRYPARWLALKLMEGDSQVMQEADLRDTGLIDSVVQHLRAGHDEDLESLLADERYAQAAGLAREVVRKPELRQREFTERIDRVVLNRFLGLPLFFAAMWLVFKLTFDVATPFVDWIDAITSGPVQRWVTVLLAAAHASAWTASLVTDGIIAGMGFVVVFIPVIFAMMFCITFLEGSGYMARAAFVMDRAMHAIGLHGKSFIPMLLGFGCNVPAIYATRTLENPRDKVLTALLVPLMSCGARLPVYVLFAGAFFPGHAGTVLWSLYVSGILLAVLMGLIFKRTLFKGESPVFIMELPPYRLPSLKGLLIHTWEKGRHFLVKAGTYILTVSVLVWCLLNLPWGVEHKKDSYLGKAGQIVALVLAPLGFGNWEAASSLITGVIAKEIIVGTMGEIYAPTVAAEPAPKAPSVGAEIREIGSSFAGAVREAGANVFSTFGVSSMALPEEEGQGALREVIRGAFTPLSAYAFMTFVLLYMPCAVVAVAMRQEFGTWKWSGVAVVYQTLLAWAVAFCIYQGGRLLGLE